MSGPRGTRTPNHKSPTAHDLTTKPQQSQRRFAGPKTAKGKGWGHFTRFLWQLRNPYQLTNQPGRVPITPVTKREGQELGKGGGELGEEKSGQVTKRKPKRFDPCHPRRRPTAPSSNAFFQAGGRRKPF